LSAPSTATVALLEQRAFERADGPRANRPQVRCADIGDKDRKQRAGVDDDHALVPVEPEQVRIPIVLARCRSDELDIGFP